MADSPLENVPILTRRGERLSAEALRTHLRRLILDGTLPPGQLPSQVDLAERLGVSRTPLREALRMLQEEGLIEIQPNHRARIVGLAPESIDALYGSRILLEGLAAQVTVARLGRQDLDQIERAFDELREASASGDSSRWERCHARFHRLLVMHAGSPLKRQLEQHIDQTERYRVPSGSIPPARCDAEHAQIVEAYLTRRATDAAALLAWHLGQTALALMNQLAPEEEPRHLRAALSIMRVREQSAGRREPSGREGDEE